LPPLDTPNGLSAELQAGGQVQLNWQPVDGAAVYELYRQAPGEAGLTFYQRPVGTSFEETLGIDGDYFYAVASVRQANGDETVSSQSNTVQVTLDTQAPDAPTGLDVQLIGANAQATWTPPGGAEPLTYSLYRGATADFLLADGTLVKGNITVNGYVDPAPSSSARHYRVAAVDAAGNVSQSSASFELVFIVLPVTDMQIELIDGLPPVITWNHDGFNLAGYHVLLADGAARLPLSQSLLTQATFTDSGYANDYREYVVVAEDNDGQLSAQRSVRLPPIEVTLPVETMLERGVFNLLEFAVTNAASAPVSGLTLSVDVEGVPSQSALFSLGAGEQRVVTVPVVGLASLPDLATLQTTIEVNPVPGERVRFQRSGDIPVGNGLGLVLDIIPEEIIRGGQGSMRFTLQNPGSIETQVVVAHSSGAKPSAEMRLKLQDEFGNIYLVEPVKLGPANVDILNGGGVVATIPPDSTYESESIVFNVPVDVPEALTLTLEIDTLHYHLGQPDAASISGLDTSRGVTLIDTPYSGTVDTISPPLSRGGEDIVISGQALIDGTSTALASVPLNLVITVAGFERSYEVITDPTGQYSLSFKPLVGESGSYSVAAIHPDVVARPQQGTFAIGRLLVDPGTINLRTARNLDQPLSVRASVFGSEAAVPGTNLRVVYEAADQTGGVLLPGIQITSPAPVSLGSGQTVADLNITFRADDAAPQSGALVLKLLTDETGADPVALLQVNFQLVQALANLHLGAGFLETGVVQGESINETLSIENVGIVDSEEVLITLLSADGRQAAPDWISLTSAEQQASIKVGETRPIHLTISPPATLQDGHYQYQLRILDGGNVQNIPIGVTVSAAGQGSVLFYIADVYTGWDEDPEDAVEAQLGVEDAKISLVSERTPGVNSYDLTTGLDGSVLSPDVPVGWYRFRVTKQNHEELGGRVQIKSGVTVSRDLFLDFVLINVEWSVQEITLEDRYEIVLNAVFETNVPGAVVVAEPASVTLPDMDPGDVYYGEFTLTNHGLIKAEDLEVFKPSASGSFSYELLEGLPAELAPNESIRVPYRVIMTDLIEADPGAGAGASCMSGSGTFSAFFSSLCPSGYRYSGNTSHAIGVYSNKSSCTNGWIDGIEDGGGDFLSGLGGLLGGGGGRVVSSDNSDSRGGSGTTNVSPSNTTAPGNPGNGGPDCAPDSGNSNDVSGDGGGNGGTSNPC